ncbi:gamma subclass chorismate mutase AroQ [Rhodobacterales bacterium HKCCSP123]|nr:gamma subclass chorismate mutase AroQ [Rhodobacterales bacterium HKCCSP123]
MRKEFLSAGLALALSAPLAIGAARAEGDATALPGLITERLSLMRDVAAWKFLRELPVEDLPREAAVLEAMATRAEELGLAPAPLVAFSAAQIEAAKAIQSCWIDRWTGGAAPAPTEAPDLAAVIRPEILRIDAALVGLVATGEVPAAMTPPEIDCLSPEVAAALAEAATGLAAPR